MGLRDLIKIGAAGKVTSAFDIARLMALGADWCNAARGFMFAVGCIQSQNCHTGRCPTGVATQDPGRQRGLDPGDKSERVYHFQKNTVKALAEILAAAGLRHPDELGPEHIIRRINPETVLPPAPVLARGPVRFVRAAGLDPEPTPQQIALSILPAGRLSRKMTALGRLAQR